MPSLNKKTAKLINYLLALRFVKNYHYLYSPNLSTENYNTFFCFVNVFFVI